jgi:hypothetical protein
MLDDRLHRDYFLPAMALEHQVMVRLDSETFAKATQAALAEGRTLSAWIRRTIEREFTAHFRLKGAMIRPDGDGVVHISVEHVGIEESGFDRTQFGSDMRPPICIHLGGRRECPSPAFGNTIQISSPNDPLPIVPELQEGREVSERRVASQARNV